MKNIQIHSLEGEMLFSEEGAQRLATIVNSSASCVIVFSSDIEKILDIKNLVKYAKEHLSLIHI